MTVRMLLERFEEAGLRPAAQKHLSDEILNDRLNRTIDHLAHDSRKVRDDGVFFAIRGGTTDGHLFIDKAVKQDALLVVCESTQGVDNRNAAVITVSNSRRALAIAAAAYYGDPSQDLTMVGITGTNGKTTTAHLVHRVLQADGSKAGVVGTIGVKFGDEERTLGLTTPDPIKLHESFREMVDAGCTSCVMEVSSHALDQHRTDGIAFDVAVFLNLSQDHLDYHESMDDYMQAKKRLFDGLLPDAVAIYNLDDGAAQEIIADTEAQLQSFGTSPDADLPIQIEKNKLDGLLLSIGDHRRQFSLVGAFNAYNLAAAFGVGISLEHDHEEVLDALAAVPSVPGRFERLQAADGLRAIVDYAHSPDALENVLQTLREVVDEHTPIWCVFGCGGDRDKGKRPKMGRIAEDNADRLIITSDNPRSEDPQAIIEDILQGLAAPEDAQVIPDRREAIKSTISQADSHDVILIAGKGHEATQTVGQQQIHFDDREEVTRFFEERDARNPK